MADNNKQDSVKKQIDTVFSIANTLRGTYQPDKYRDVIIPMVILRRLECALEETKDAVCDAYEQNPNTPEAILRAKSGYSFYNTSRYTLKKLLGEGQHLKERLKTYIDGFSPNIKEIFSDLEFKKEIDKMAKGSKLTGVVRKFSELDLDPDTVSNMAMGYMFEEVIRRFSENAEAGDHYTPREVIRLVTRLALAEGCEDLLQPGKVVKVGDFACGTGGMLSVAREQLAESCPGADVYLYGQEVIPDTHAVALADMLIKGQRAENIRLADTMKEDCFPDDKMRLVLMNPPFGQAWGGKDASDGVEKAVNDEFKRVDSRFPAGLPAKSDMQLLFMQHVISKLDDECGRAAVISNGSPLFSGSTASGESQIRRWLLENDYVEAIVGLTGDLFYNTGIGIYIWVLAKSKSPKRRGFVQLIDATDKWEKMRKSLGKKRKEISSDQIDEIVELYTIFEENERSRILPNEEFLYKEYTVKQPLQRSYQITEERIEEMTGKKLKEKFHDPAKLEELSLIDEADRTEKERQIHQRLIDAAPVVQNIFETLKSNVMEESTQDYEGFRKTMRELLAPSFEGVSNEVTKQKNDIIDKIMDAMSEMDKEAPLRYKRDGSILYDDSTKDTEIVRLLEDVEDYCEREVYPYVPDAKWFDEEDDKHVKTGAEIPFTRYFYKYEEPESSDELLEEFDALEAQLRELMA